VQNEDRALKGGMFAQGELVLDKNDPVLSIPSGAVKYEAGVPIVYTLADGKIVRQQVTVGEQIEGSDYIELRSGLKEGERAIVPEIGERNPGDAAFVRGESAPPAAKPTG
jgi:multidrug efflux pump subunit AcrA (membrane-fusion protein)